MTPFADLIPIVAFFVCYQLTDIYTATVTMMVVSVAQLMISLLKKEPIPTTRWINLTTLMVLGSITLIFKNSHVIKIKPTVGYLIGAMMFRVQALRGSVTIPEEALGKILYLPKESWEQANNAWIIFLCVLGALNLLIAYTTPTSTWIYFKLFGFLLMILFTIAQIVYFVYFKKNNINHELIER